MGYKYYPGKIYFITYKTFQGEKYFIDDWGKEIVFGQLQRCELELGMAVLAYAVLSNHYHLLVKVYDYKIIRKALQYLNGGTSREYNLVTGIKQSLWGAEKFNREVVDQVAFDRILAYIVSNPLKHGLVKDLAELKKYKYCSYLEAMIEYGEEVINNLILKNLKLDLETVEAWERIYSSVNKPIKVG